MRPDSRMFGWVQAFRASLVVSERGKKLPFRVVTKPAPECFYPGVKTGVQLIPKNVEKNRLFVVTPAKAGVQAVRK
jgi:hypothetical protein